jgi:hypothetical protein
MRRIFRKRRVTISRVVFIAGCVTIAVLAVVRMQSDFSQTPIPISALRPVLYPDAKDVNVEESNSHESKVVTYRTPAKPNQVYAFYRDVLSREGWKYPYLSNDGLYVQWCQAGFDGPTGLGYRLRVVARVADAGLTNVEVRVVIMTTECM